MQSTVLPLETGKLAAPQSAVIAWIFSPAIAPLLPNTA
jgi:hypothetical protein